MSTDAMKLELIEWLTRLNDPGVLASLLNWKKASEVKDWYTSLSPEQKASIDRGLADAAAGRTVTSEEVWKRYGRSAKG
ncbi:MAG: hypothetical protein IPJ87_12215 [Flavobacteriales bacterium]|jgi:hypothetical protein|nr:hypothetical protein [Flavobacteriales bacterium]MBK7942616.1 hypothetical protein [Flavobacteriales bacterium]MBK8950863.1 hypothetical protein [Flavobacteriales bacterium]MBK9698981.1 hypothetical protein [Flavobacteriales bacterium]